MIEELTEGQEAGERFAEAVERLADAADALLEAGLTRRAIVVLLRDKTVNVRTGDIEEVLNCLPLLREYLVES